MTFFAQAETALPSKTKDSQLVAIGVAVLIVGMVTAQLFSFEDFPSVIEKAQLPFSSDLSSVWAALIVISEVAALPFLLRMILSPLARVISMIFGWVSVAGWLWWSLAVNLNGVSPENSGVLGATIAVPSGSWMIFLFGLLAILVGWASWGLWPFAEKHSK